MALRGDLRRISDLKRRLREFPASLAHDVATRTAPKLTSLTREAFDAKKSVYGDPRPAGVNGNALALRRTGATERGLTFVSVGTIVRCVLAKKYMRYLIGKYGVLPGGKSAMPVEWADKIREIVASSGGSF